MLVKSTQRLIGTCRYYLKYFDHVPELHPEAIKSNPALLESTAKRDTFRARLEKYYYKATKMNGKAFEIASALYEINISAGAKGCYDLVYKVSQDGCELCRALTFSACRCLRCRRRRASSSAPGFILFGRENG